MDSEDPSSSSAVDQIVSDDDEICYSIKPEFYDHCSDDKDEAWLERRRKGRSSDAILSCRACFTTLCIDCQRNLNYPNSMLTIG
ncbi:hypothetical protein SUGI_0666480 [Cryptomeria japonica]|uniref:uncharacterized protein LOC131056765 n=1 Tax=Cryptomeria japonica TaxID=3369 RepID=UPI002414B50C|nr:uncharacterized protein LOC131056765 [Cryptomeria japonica]GLJ33115.1 hypothetical protein SUGI_0666480 [Cryptomeria japonica]